MIVIDRRRRSIGVYRQTIWRLVVEVQLTIQPIRSYRYASILNKYTVFDLGVELSALNQSRLL